MEWILFAFVGGAAGALIDYSSDRLLAASTTRAKLPWRAPVIVIVSALAFVVVWIHLGVSAQAVLVALYTAVFLFVLVTDLEDRAIFSFVLVAGTVMAVIASPISQIGLARALLGGAVAFAIVFGIYACSGLYARVRRLKIPGGAFGRGDVYLATFMGVVVGFPSVLPAIAITILLGGAGAIVFLAYQLIAHRRLALTAAIPYGPFFCLAGWAMMVFGT